MGFSQDVFRHLRDDAAIGALVGDKIFAQVARPEAERPYVTYSQVDRDPVQTLLGSSNLDTRRLRLTSYADRYADSEAIADALKLLFDGFSGTLGDSTEITHSTLIDGDDDYVQETQEPEVVTHRVRLDFDVWIDSAA